MNEHVTPNQASKQAFGILSPGTKASNLLCTSQKECNKLHLTAAQYF
jgi:hypothetical protein